MQRRRVILAVLATLVAAATVRADLMPMAPSPAPVCQETPPDTTTNGGQSGSREREGETARTEEGRLVLSSSHFSTFLPSYVPGFSASGRADVQSLLVRSSPDWEGVAGQGGETQPMQILSDRQSSFSLCLYALLGLGLFRSAPLVKKLPFGCIPSWYHEGGPGQIGHSHAISPDCLCSAPVYSFVPPDRRIEDAVPRYHWATVVAHWWRSQFIPTVFASRAPPSCSCLGRL
jgi:hypothetical protein